MAIAELTDLFDFQIVFSSMHMGGFLKTCPPILKDYFMWLSSL